MTYYIVWTDTFMSGWGRSKGRKNVCYHIVKSRHQGENMIKLLRGSRSDWVNFRVTTRKPQDSSRVLVSKVNPKLWIQRVYAESRSGRGR